MNHDLKRRGINTWFDEDHFGIIDELVFKLKEETMDEAYRERVQTAIAKSSSVLICISEDLNDLLGNWDVDDTSAVLAEESITQYSLRCASEYLPPEHILPVVVQNTMRNTDFWCRAVKDIADVYQNVDLTKAIEEDDFHWERSLERIYLWIESCKVIKTSSIKSFKRKYRPSHSAISSFKGYISRHVGTSTRVSI